MHKRIPVIKHMKMLCQPEKLLACVLPNGQLPVVLGSEYILKHNFYYIHLLIKILIECLPNSNLVLTVLVDTRIYDCCFRPGQFPGYLEDWAIGLIDMSFFVI